MLHGFTQSTEFDKAYVADLKLIPPNTSKQMFYYVTPEQTIRAEHRYDRAKREVFAQLFALSAMPSTQITPADLDFIELFPSAHKIISKLKI